MNNLEKIKGELRALIQTIHEMNDAENGGSFLENVMRKKIITYEVENEALKKEIEAYKEMVKCADLDISRLRNCVESYSKSSKDWYESYREESQKLYDLKNKSKGWFRR